MQNIADLLASPRNTEGFRGASILPTDLLLDRFLADPAYPALIKRASDGSIVDAVMVNISNTGIGIRTTCNLQIDTHLTFITLDNTIDFKVIWCSPDSEIHGFRVGLEQANGHANLTKTFRWMWERWAIDHL